MGVEAEVRGRPARHVVLLGAPGSGKGTQAERLADRLGVPWISTGEMLREAVASGNELGNRVASILDSGGLVDDATMASVVRNRLAQADAKAGFLLDGYPRNEPQAETLSGIFANIGLGLDLVVFIDVPEEELMRRALARKRGADDQEDVIRRRLGVYRENTEPLIDYYEKLRLLVQVNGAQPIEDVTKEILIQLGVDA